MKKIGLICIALVMAMGAMGVGYARWYQNLYIDGTVETGTFATGFISQTTDDPPADDGTVGMLFPTTSPEYGTLDPGYDKNVAACNCTLLVKKGAKEYGDPPVLTDIFEKVHVTVMNAYPSYSNNLTVGITNFGDIPANVGKVNITKIGGVSVTSIELPKGTTVEVDLDGDTKADVNLTWNGPADQQIDPCDTVLFSLTIHVKQDAPQGASLSFELTVDTGQWNVAP